MVNTIDTSKLTDSELVRMDFTIWRKMREGGGTMFGVSWNTMKLVHPHLLQWLRAVRTEREVRGV